MADYMHIRRGYMPHDMVDTHTNGWSKTGFSEGYGDHVYKRSVMVCNPNEGCVIKTQTIVEEVSVPAMTLHGNSYPTMEGQRETYEFAEYGGGFHAMGGPGKVYGTISHGGSPPAKGGSVTGNGVADNRTTRPVSPPHHQLLKTNEFVSDAHTDAGQPSKTSPMCIMNWRQRPYYDGHDGSTDNGMDGYRTNIYDGHNETAHNGYHPHFEGYHGRNETETYRKPTQGRLIAPKEIFPSTIDSREAARRYGGSYVPPQAIREAETYTPTIDSYEAAQRYKGQIL